MLEPVPNVVTCYAVVGYTPNGHLLAPFVLVSEYGLAEYAVSLLDDNLDSEVDEWDIIEHFTLLPEVLTTKEQVHSNIFPE